VLITKILIHIIWATAARVRDSRYCYDSRHRARPSLLPAVRRAVDSYSRAGLVHATADHVRPLPPKDEYYATRSLAAHSVQAAVPARGLHATSVRLALCAPCASASSQHASFPPEQKLSLGYLRPPLSRPCCRCENCERQNCPYESFAFRPREVVNCLLCTMHSFLLRLLLPPSHVGNRPAAALLQLPAVLDSQKLAAGGRSARAFLDEPGPQSLLCAALSRQLLASPSDARRFRHVPPL
jgi:hypothetical protein